ncbi:MAG: hypothetical protein MJ189_05455, partial [Coriobacteriales bacterium]|nr:hypothetical protein [Coriobacteriales bacterium]
MKVDKVYKNAKVYTSNVEAINANAFAVKDGKFVYVGDEAGLADFEGEIIDLGGKFVMPAIIDSHIHIAICIPGEYGTPEVLVEGNGKSECLDIMRKAVQEHPNSPNYRFRMSKASLKGGSLTKDDL